MSDYIGIRLMSTCTDRHL